MSKKNEVWDRDEDLARKISKSFSAVIKGFDATLPGDVLGLNNFLGSLKELESLILDAMHKYPEACINLNLDGLKDEYYNSLEGYAFIGYWRGMTEKEAELEAQIARDKRAANAAYKKRALENERLEYERLKAKYEK